ncbi:hypothetical protein MJ_ECL02 (plasmid) [Methanocaldococcus jannaschii DSM 2661]|uniref:Uncharacterized protein MJECL02 n=2 Tax=Methanocaldococcus jannaschii TaxID=2190 RepID=Y3502_METJA|nr:RecName: Full=Uncharacterized protein MJECL02 [Methanocaldococcus jannaschii DSM 2661]AAC37076.1 hypothetical protein MJ_ECL02 [Methanocaldococcus jannaschii DSM 2661]
MLMMSIILSMCIQMIRIKSGLSSVICVYSQMNNFRIFWWDIMTAFEELLELPTIEAIYKLKKLILKMESSKNSEVYYYQGVIKRIIQRLSLLDQEKSLKENLKFCVDNYILSQRTIEDLKTAIEIASKL